jgi:acetolactate decarboxylase
VPKLECEVPEGLLRALAARSDQTGLSIAEIVVAALTEALEIEEQPLFQVSTAAALVEGVTGGAVSVAELRERGDFGIGTFAGLDGELVALEGAFFQVRADGVVSEPRDDDLVPFAVVTDFRAEREVRFERVAGFGDLEAQLDWHRQTDNLFYAVRIDGRFARVKTRSVRETAPGVPLVQAAANQVEFDLDDIAGTLVGFWTPEYARTLNVAGWHLHFLSDGRTAGGHVLDCEGANLRVQVQDLADVRIAMPQTDAFLAADLSDDPSAELETAERARDGDP